MNIIEIIIILFFTMLILALIIFVIYVKIKTKKEEDKGGDIIINLASKRSNRRCVGIKKNIETGRRGRELTTYIPKGIGDSSEMEKEMRVIHDKKISVPRGELEKDCCVDIILPRNSEDLSDDIKETPWGIILSKYIENKNIDKNIIDVLRTARERQDSIRLLLGAGELSKAEIRRLVDMSKQIDNLLIRTSEKRGTNE